MEKECFIERWLDAHRQTTNDHLPAGTITADESNVFAISIKSIIPWNISTSIKHKLDELQCRGERRVACSISMSFFHVPSKKFYGTTFAGHEHTFTLKSLNEMSNLSINNLNEMIYFQTTVVDPNAVVVCELVAALYDAFGEGIEKRYGCGFAVISPFSNCDEVDKKSPNDPIKSGPICVYDGSPRDLLSLKSHGGSMFQQLRKQETKSVLTYKIWDRIDVGKVLKDSHIVSMMHFVSIF